jgi:alpha-galactosidase
VNGRFRVVAEIPVAVDSARVYENGWQSWSPAGCYGIRQLSPRPSHAWQQAMRFRPETPPPATGFQGEGMLAVCPGDGDPWHVFAATDPATVVPSVRARLEGDMVVVTSDGSVSGTTAPSLREALTVHGDMVAQRLGVTIRAAPTVWCSWYHYFLDVTEEDIDENVQALTAHDLPADVVQVDDGWQSCIGDWLTLADRFHSTRDLAARIRDSGRRAGIWLAPFIAGTDSVLAREHPEWLVGDAGHNWGQDLHGLDLTHPGVQGHLARVFEGLVEQGYDYFKLDFLYGGALLGNRHADATGVEAYRAGLRVVREAVGDGFVTGCGAPLLPSIGLVDAMRVSPDTYNPTDPDGGEDVLRGRPCIEARAWQHGRWWINDSDCLVARPKFARRAEWAAVVERYGGLRSVSDRILDLDEWGLETTRRVLATAPAPTPFGTLPELCGGSRRLPSQ